MTAEPDTAQVKACCADGYSSDLVGLLLGASYHPGGLRLTRRLLDALPLRSGDHVVDVASGVGTTSLVAAQEYDARVVGVDLSASNVSLAIGAADGAGLTGQVEFRAGDAESLPLVDATYDAVVCECALCTFPDKASAAAEMARVLRPGGRVGLTDVTAHRDRLPDELTGLVARVACVADARPAEEYRRILEAAGLRVTTVERHTRALRRMIDQIEARLELLRMTSRSRAESLGVDFGRATPVLAAAHRAVDDGTLDYVLMTAEKEQG